MFEQLSVIKTNYSESNCSIRVFWCGNVMSSMTRYLTLNEKWLLAEHPPLGSHHGLFLEMSDSRKQVILGNNEMEKRPVQKEVITETVYSENVILAFLLGYQEGKSMSCLYCINYKYNLQILETCAYCIFRKYINQQMCI